MQAFIFGNCSGFSLLIWNFLANVLIIVMGLALAKLPVHLLEFFFFSFFFFCESGLNFDEYD